MKYYVEGITIEKSRHVEGRLWYEIKIREIDDLGLLSTLKLSFKPDFTVGDQISLTIDYSAD